jgi:flagellar biosynthesis/type III secretory pathway M-ring protein FliF/YscJ
MTNLGFLNVLIQRGLGKNLPPTLWVARLRMSLAGDGLPKGGGVGYEIFDSWASSLSSYCASLRRK